MTEPAPATPSPTVPGRDAPERSGARRGQGIRVFWEVLRANPLTLIGFVLVAFIGAVAALVAGVPALSGLLGHGVSILPHDPVYGFSSSKYAPPSVQHWMGTDDVGRDMFSRVLAALPVDLGLGFAISGFGLVVGGILGLVSGYWNRPWTLGGVLSEVILRLTDIFLSVPSILLALALVEAYDQGGNTSASYVAAVVALMITWWPYYVRLVRGEVQAIKQQPYITAARAAGVKDSTIVIRHVLRNLIEPLVVYYTMDVGTVIVVFSTISYVVPHAFPVTIPEWGTMIAEYTQFFPHNPWPLLSVSFAIIVTVLAFSLLGDGLRDILDPRSRRVLATAGSSARVESTAGSAGP